MPRAKSHLSDKAYKCDATGMRQRPRLACKKGCVRLYIVHNKLDHIVYKLDHHLRATTPSSMSHRWLRPQAQTRPHQTGGTSIVDSVCSHSTGALRDQSCQ